MRIVNALDFTHQQDTGRMKEFGQVCKDRLGGNYRAAEHAVNGNVAMNNRYKSMIKGGTNWR